MTTNFCLPFLHAVGNVLCKNCANSCVLWWTFIFFSLSTQVHLGSLQTRHKCPCNNACHQDWAVPANAKWTKHIVAVHAMFKTGALVGLRLAFQLPLTSWIGKLVMWQSFQLCKLSSDLSFPEKYFCVENNDIMMLVKGSLSESLFKSFSFSLLMSAKVLEVRMFSCIIHGKKSGVCLSEKLDAVWRVICRRKLEVWLGEKLDASWFVIRGGKSGVWLGEKLDSSWFVIHGRKSGGTTVPGPCEIFQS